jgi:hypothetical protein
VPFGHACSSTSSCAEKEAGALFEGLRDFLRVARAHTDPRKVSGH